MSERIRFIISAVLMLLGLVSMFIALFGVYRFRFVMNRMHCAAIIDTMGIFFLLLGLMVACGRPEYLPKLVLIVMLLWIGSPISSHLVGRLEISTDDSAGAHMKQEDRR